MKYDLDNKIDLSLTDDFKYFNDEGLDYVMLPNGKPITSFTLQVVCSQSCL